MVMALFAEPTGGMGDGERLLLRILSVSTKLDLAVVPVAARVKRWSGFFL